MADQKKLVIIDGYSLLFRAFYSVRFLNTSTGRPTNALFGFVSMLFYLLENERPDAIVVALDAPGKTFRDAEYPEYKGTRKETPAELVSQLKESREVIGAFNIPCIELTGYEADDVVGTIARQAEAKGYDTTIVTGDLDSLQLVDGSVQVMTTLRGVTETKVYDIAAVQERYGFGPSLVPDYKALVGDTSDNIPGVPGIGDKTAKILISDFGGIEQIIHHMDDIPDKFSKKLKGNEPQMIKSKWLATINCEAPIEYDFAPYQFPAELIADTKALLHTLEFKNHLKRFDLVLGPYMDSPAKAVVEISNDALEFSTIEQAQTLDQLVGWTGGKPFAIAEPSKPEQGSLLEEDIQGDAYVCVGRDVRRTSWENAKKLFFLHPDKAMVADSKVFFAESPFETLTPAKFDARIAAYVLQSGRSNYDLADIAQGYLDISMPQTPQEKAAALPLLADVLPERAKAEGQDFILDQVEMPLVPLLAEMEGLGIKVSRSELSELSKQLKESIEQIQARIYDIAEEEFNISSPKQLGVILFEKLMLPGGKKTKTGWGTSAEILEPLALDHEIVAEILAYRHATKLKSTYADALPLQIAGDGRVHTTFNQTVAATGRLSSINPNLQNIPVRTDQGQEIRKAFQADEGNVLLSFDYSQIELRVLAHMSGEPSLVRAFQENSDVHAITAAQMYGIDPKDVSKEQRRQAKILNFAGIYGVFPAGLARQLGPGFTIKDATQLLEQYNARFPGVKDFSKSIIDQAKSTGYTTTLDGRRRYLGEIHAGNATVRNAAERQAMNAPIQGTAADMIKIAMLKTRQVLEGTSCKMLLQVHDELLFELPESDLAIAEQIRSAMVTARELNVPVVVDAKVGKNWRDMSPFN